MYDGSKSNVHLNDHAGLTGLCSRQFSAVFRFRSKSFQSGIVLLFSGQSVQMRCPKCTLLNSAPGMIKLIL